LKVGGLGFWSTVFIFIDWNHWHAAGPPGEPNPKSAFLQEEKHRRHARKKK
jgi:hypothetical protein